jgi:hypothetical protein
LIDAGDVVELRVQPSSLLQPLGLLRPAGASTDAAELLSRYLQRHFAARQAARAP